jgi:hypothetical protein
MRVLESRFRAIVEAILIAVRSEVPKMAHALCAAFKRRLTRGSEPRGHRRKDIGPAPEEGSEQADLLLGGLRDARRLMAPGAVRELDHAIERCELGSERGEAPSRIGLLGLGAIEVGLLSGDRLAERIALRIRH